MADDTEMTDASDPAPIYNQTTGSTEDISKITTAHPPTFDAGNLLINDPAPLPPSTTQSREATIATRAQYCAQSLITHLLTTCPIHTSSAPDKALLMTLPPTTTPIPREKPLPKSKEKTRWERFAEKKGIASNSRKDSKSNMVYDEEKGDWVPRWGYKGKNKQGEGEWLVEVDEKKEREMEQEGVSVRGAGRRERKEKMKRQERKERANERRARKGAG